MTAIEGLEWVIKAKGKSWHWVGQQCNETPSQIYNRRIMGDLKFEVLKKYLNALGCDLYIKDRYSPAEWKL